MEDKKVFSFLEKAYNPYLQAGAILIIVIVFMAIGSLVFGPEEGKPYLGPWITATAFLLMYAMFNAISGLSAKNVDSYFPKSIVAFAGLVAGSILFAWLFSGIGINEAGSVKWIYMVFVFAYLVFLSIMGFIKRIVEFAQKEEWNHPRIRNRKKK